MKNCAADLIDGACITQVAATIATMLSAGGNGQNRSAYSLLVQRLT